MVSGVKFLDVYLVVPNLSIDVFKCIEPCRSVFPVPNSSFHNAPPPRKLFDGDAHQTPRMKERVGSRSRSNSRPSPLRLKTPQAQKKTKNLRKYKNLKIKIKNIKLTQVSKHLVIKMPVARFLAAGAGFEVRAEALIGGEVLPLGAFLNDSEGFTAPPPFLPLALPPFPPFPLLAGQEGKKVTPSFLREKKTRPFMFA